MSTPTKYLTWAFTLRPRDGVTDKQVEKMEKYLHNHAQYWKIITEKEGDQRHMHTAFVLKNPSSKSNVAVYLTRMYKDLDAEETAIMRQGLKIWYNKDFLDYLDKDDDTVVISSNLPEVSHLEAFFPPKPVVLAPGQKKQLANHAMLENLEKLWMEHVPTHYVVNTENARNFMWSMMYEKRLIGVILDDKRIDQVSRALVRWMLKANTCTVPLPPFQVEEGEDVHPLIRH